MRTEVPVLTKDLYNQECSTKRDNDRVNIKITSRAFSDGFDIATSSETFGVAQSPSEEYLITNAHGTQIARIAKDSFHGSVYNIIISGGELYQIVKDKRVKRLWTCSGGGRTIQLREEKSRHFVVEAESRKIAQCSKEWLTSDYSITLLDTADFKLVVGIFLALSLSQNRGSDFFIPA